MVAHVTSTLFSGSDIDVDQVEVHRVLDNKVIFLDGENFWIAMNYQLIHLLDFLPVERWWENINDHAFCFSFASVYNMLLKSGKLMVQIDADMPIPSEGKTPATLGELFESWIDIYTDARRSTKRNITDYSGSIGHSLDYKLTFRAAMQTM